MRSGQILLVEDEETIRNTLRLSLEMEGFTVVAAANGQEALDWLYDGLTPRLILLDLMMPILDGWQFIEKVKDDASLGTIPIVLVTAFAERAKGMPVKEVMRKPVDLDTLSTVARKYCGAPMGSDLQSVG